MVQQQCIALVLNRSLKPWPTLPRTWRAWDSGELCVGRGGRAGEAEGRAGWVARDFEIASVTNGVALWTALVEVGPVGEEPIRARYARPANQLEPIVARAGGDAASVACAGGVSTVCNNRTSGARRV